MNFFKKHVSLLIFSISALMLNSVCAAEKTVKVTDFHPGKNDATEAIRKAIGSGASKVIFDHPGFEYLTEPIMLRSNQELIFEDGVSVRAMPGKFKGLGDSLFTCKGLKNVILRGNGKATLRMNKKDYQNQAIYKHSEWRFGIALFNSENIQIKNLSILSSGGDGVYIGGSGKPNKNIKLENLILDDHHRQGISIINAENLLIRKCKISNTKGTRPEAGIDFEPNRPDEVIINNVIEDCEIFGNAYSGILVNFPRVLAKPISITIRNCTMINNTEGIKIAFNGMKNKYFDAMINIENCLLKNNLNTQLLINLPDNKKGEIKVKMKDVTLVDDSGKKPIMLSCPGELGGLDFGNLTVKQKDFSDPIAISVLGLEPIAGSLTLVNPKNEKKSYDLVGLQKANSIKADMKNFRQNQLILTDLVPAKKKSNEQHNIIVRYEGKLLQYVKKGEVLRLNFSFRKLAKTIGMRVVAKNESGKTVTSFRIDKMSDTWEYIPEETGFLIFEFKPYANGIRITSNQPGHGFITPLWIYRYNSVLYFEAPAALKQVTVKITIPANETVSAALYDGSGKLQLQKNNLSGHQLLNVSQPEGTKTQIWKLVLTKISNTCNIALAAPLRPILYTSPDNMLKEEKRHEQKTEE